MKLAKEKLSKKDEKNLFINNAFSVIEKQIEKTQSAMFEDEKEIHFEPDFEIPIPPEDDDK